jgi:hypothetical protein
MRYLLGTDEAGYGPNLGPLVISATLWEAPDDLDADQMFTRLARAIATKPSQLANAGPYVAMADSKQLYSPDKGLRHLERGLWAAFGLLNHRPRSWRDVWQTLSPGAIEAAMLESPWYADYDPATPFDCKIEDVDAVVEPLRNELTAAGVRLVAVRSRPVFEAEFNDLVAEYDSKGAALSHETLALAAALIAPLPNSRISVLCDKHGGRNTYGPLLADHFPDGFIEIHGESREKSFYRFGPEDRRIDFCFRTKAEACLPAALASMASKYLREMAMEAFNAYWCKRVPGLKPTAGYPQDAKRVRQEVADVQKQLKIPDRVFWRVK